MSPPLVFVESQEEEEEEEEGKWIG